MRRIPVRIEGETLTGKWAADEWAVAVQAEPGKAPEKQGKAHTRWCSRAYRVAAAREVTPSLL